MEIVSEPDLTSADMAYEYLNALKEILVYGGVSDCDMEKGMVRCDVNVSVRPKGTKELGAKIEIKNMNSFSGVRRALEYEIPRQIEVAQEGGKLDPIHAPLGRRGGHHRGDAHQGTRARLPLFPGAGPDAVPADGGVAGGGAGRVVELPLARKQRFMRDYQLPAPDAQTFMWDVPLGDYFEGIAQAGEEPEGRGQLGHQQSARQAGRDE